MCQVPVRGEGVDIVQRESQLEEQEREGKNRREVQRGMAETQMRGRHRKIARKLCERLLLINLPTVVGERTGKMNRGRSMQSKHCLILRHHRVLFIIKQKSHTDIL